MLQSVEEEKKKAFQQDIGSEGSFCIHGTQSLPKLNHNFLDRSIAIGYGAQDTGRKVLEGIEHIISSFGAASTLAAHGTVRW